MSHLSIRGVAILIISCLLFDPTISAAGYSNTSRITPSANIYFNSQALAGGVGSSWLPFIKQSRLVQVHEGTAAAAVVLKSNKAKKTFAALFESFYFWLFGGVAIFAIYMLLNEHMIQTPDPNQTLDTIQANFGTLLFAYLSALAAALVQAVRYDRQTASAKQPRASLLSILRRDIVTPLRRNPLWFWALAWGGFLIHAVNVQLFSWPISIMWISAIIFTAIQSLAPTVSGLLEHYFPLPGAPRLAMTPQRWVASALAFFGTLLILSASDRGPLGAAGLFHLMEGGAMCLVVVLLLCHALSVQNFVGEKIRQQDTASARAFLANFSLAGSVIQYTPALIALSFFWGILHITGHHPGPLVKLNRMLPWMGLSYFTGIAFLSQAFKKGLKDGSLFFMLLPSALVVERSLWDLVWPSPWKIAGSLAIIGAAIVGMRKPSAASSASAQNDSSMSPLVMIPESDITAFRGHVLHFLRAPTHTNDEGSYQYYPDGVLLVENGKVKGVGPANKLLPELGPDVRVTHYPDSLIMPGFVDTHVHYPQTEMIASPGEQLLEWLNKYTFPTEAKFKDKEYARNVADFFLKELLRNGTTSALVFSTVHKVSAEALFEAAEELNMRLITGKVLMDRNAPGYLLDTPELGYLESAELIRQWHGRGRLRYAVTPRFAPTSTEEQLTSAGRLVKKFPDVHLHTHLSENTGEVDWVRALFPWSRNYLDVYDRFGLLGPKSHFAHSIHLSDPEWVRLAETVSSVAFCPTSNLFLGSGLFNLAKSRAHGVKAGIGSDVGAGTSFSMLRNLNAGYGILQLQNQTLSALEAFYLATLGGARALSLDDKIGNFLPRMEADFAVLRWGTTPLEAFAMAGVTTLSEMLSKLMMLGDDRNVQATYIMGRQAYSADSLELSPSLLRAA